MLNIKHLLHEPYNTADMVAGKTVKVWEINTDRYGRIVGFVFVGDKNLNKELLSAGLAWHYKKGKPSSAPTQFYKHFSFPYHHLLSAIIVKTGKYY